MKPFSLCIIGLSCLFATPTFADQSLLATKGRHKDKDQTSVGVHVENGTQPPGCDCPGIPGPTGPQGENGEQGDPGPIGTTGARGATGCAGPQGPWGPQGNTGPAGADGNTGPQGEPGVDGNTGPIGPVGADGDTGPIGPAGADGDSGPTGPAGADGNTGPVGPKGDQGETGPIGTQSVFRAAVSENEFILPFDGFKTVPLDSVVITSGLYSFSTPTTTILEPGNYLIEYYCFGEQNPECHYNTRGKVYLNVKLSPVSSGPTIISDKVPFVTNIMSIQEEGSYQIMATGSQILTCTDNYTVLSEISTELVTLEADHTLNIKRAYVTITKLQDITP